MTTHLVTLYPLACLCADAECRRVRALEAAPLSLPGGGSALTVRWQPPALSSSPILYYLVRTREARPPPDCAPALAPSSAPPPGGTAPPWSPMMDMNETELLLTDLAPYRAYQLRVWAQTSAGRGQAATISATTAPIRE